MFVEQLTGFRKGETCERSENVGPLSASARNVHLQLPQGLLRSTPLRTTAIMPDIPVGAQIFDLAFHPERPAVFGGLLTGTVKAFTYDEQGNYEEKFSVRPSKRSCRTLAVSADGAQLWAAGKAKAIQYVCLFSLCKTEPEG